MTLRKRSCPAVSQISREREREGEERKEKTETNQRKGATFFPFLHFVFPLQMAPRLARASRGADLCRKSLRLICSMEADAEWSSALTDCVAAERPRGRPGGSRRLQAVENLPCVTNNLSHPINTAAFIVFFFFFPHPCRSQGRLCAAILNVNQLRQATLISLPLQ